MATIKAYTDLEQSQKLSEILPPESADMYYLYWKEDNHLANTQPFVADGFEEREEGLFKYLNCWSLAALLGILPLHLIINGKVYKFGMSKGFNKNGETYAIKYAIFNTTFYLHITDFYNNSIDACVEMIMKLKELKLL